MSSKKKLQDKQVSLWKDPGSGVFGSSQNIPVEPFVVKADRNWMEPILALLYLIVTAHS